MKVIINELIIIQIIIKIRFDCVMTRKVETHLNIKNERGGSPAIFIIKIVNIKLKFLNVV